MQEGMDYGWVILPTMLSINRSIAWIVGAEPQRDVGLYQTSTDYV